MYLSNGPTGCAGIRVLTLVSGNDGFIAKKRSFPCASRGEVKSQTVNPALPEVRKREKLFYDNNGYQIFGFDFYEFRDLARNALVREEGRTTGDEWPDDLGDVLSD